MRLNRFSRNNPALAFSGLMHVHYPASKISSSTRAGGKRRLTAENIRNANSYGGISPASLYLLVLQWKFPRADLPSFTSPELRNLPFIHVSGAAMAKTAQKDQTSLSARDLVLAQGGNSYLGRERRGWRCWSLVSTASDKYKRNGEFHKGQQFKYLVGRGMGREGIIFITA